MSGAGSRRRRVTIQRDAGTSRDGGGQIVPNWQALGKRWASVEPLNGIERWSERQINPELTHKVGFEWDELTSTLTAKMRIKDGTRYLNVVSTKDIEERHKSIECLCKEAL